MPKSPFRCQTDGSNGLHHSCAQFVASRSGVPHKFVMANLFLVSYVAAGDDMRKTTQDTPPSTRVKIRASTKHHQQQLKQQQQQHSHLQRAVALAVAEDGFCSTSREHGQNTMAVAIAISCNCKITEAQPTAMATNHRKQRNAYHTKDTHHKQHTQRNPHAHKQHNCHKQRENRADGS